MRNKLDAIGNNLSYSRGLIKPDFIYDIGIVIEDWYFCGIVDSGMFCFLNEVVER